MAKIYVDNKSVLKKEHWILNPNGTRDMASIRSRPPRTSSRQIRIARSTIGLILRTLPEPFKMLKTGQRARSSAGRDLGELQDARDEAEFNIEEMIRVRDLGTNTPTGVPYTEDQIMAMVRKGKQRGHIPDVGRVLAGQGRDAISINKPQCTHTHTDVDEVKEENTPLRKELSMLRTIIWSDDQMSQLLTQLESQHEVGGGNESGGGGDEDVGRDEDADRDEESWDM
ncbi:hypothetical protein Tco_0509566 [Tanacetum coccineum]